MYRNQEKLEILHLCGFFGIESVNSEQILCIEIIFKTRNLASLLFWFIKNVNLELTLRVEIIKKSESCIFAGLFIENVSMKPIECIETIKKLESLHFWLVCRFKMSIWNWHSTLRSSKNSKSCIFDLFVYWKCQFGTNFMYRNHQILEILHLCSSVYSKCQFGTHFMYRNQQKTRNLAILRVCLLKMSIWI